MPAVGKRNCNKADECFCACYACNHARETGNLWADHCQWHDYGCHMGCMEN